MHDTCSSLAAGTEVIRPGLGLPGLFFAPRDEACPILLPSSTRETGGSMQRETLADIGADRREPGPVEAHHPRPSRPARGHRAGIGRHGGRWARRRRTPTLDATDHSSARPGRHGPRPGQPPPRSRTSSTRSPTTRRRTASVADGGEAVGLRDGSRKCVTRLPPRAWSDRGPDRPGRAARRDSSGGDDRWRPRSWRSRCRRGQGRQAIAARSRSATSDGACRRRSTGKSTTNSSPP